MDEHDGKVCYVSLWVTTGQYVFLDRLPISTIAAEHLSTELYMKMMVCKRRPFNVSEVSLTTSTIGSHDSLITLSIDQAKFPQFAEITGRQTSTRQNDTVDTRGKEGTEW